MEFAAGTTLRPFYLIGHNTNSISEILEGLARGLNAFEIDVNRDDAGELYVSHGRVNALSTVLRPELPPLLQPFLVDLRQLASSSEGSPIALVIFDSKVAEAELAVELLQAVRTCLTDHVTDLHVIISVPSLRDAHTFFEPLCTKLGPREALMIDEEDDAATVAAFLHSKGVERTGYGNGITTVFGLGLPAPGLSSQIETAVALLQRGSLGFVYAWVLVAAGTMRDFLRAGVSGVMVDVDNAETLAEVLGEAEFSSRLRRAVREDDPLAPRRPRNAAFDRR